MENTPENFSADKSILDNHENQLGLGIKTRILLLFLVLGISIGIDQYTKSIAMNNLMYSPTIEVLGDFFVFKYAENDGAFLGMGSGLPEPWKTILLTVFPLLVLFGMIGYIMFSKALTKGQWIALSFILAGGLSNMYDRVMYNGFVIDFMNMGLGGFRTGIFNIADVCITGGACYFLLLPLLAKKVKA